MGVAKIDSLGNIETLRPNTDARGAFEFVEVPPGHCVVGVDLTRRTDPTIVFPTTFHPGTSDRPSAQECRVRRLTLGRRIVPKSTIVRRHLTPLVVGRQPPSIS